MPNYVPINNSIHQQLKIKKVTSPEHAKELHLTPINVHEFGLACHDFPLVFAKDSETGQFRATALLGLKPQQNVFYSNEGWHGDYVPESLKLNPFLMSINPENSDEGLLCIDTESELVNESEGEALFNEDGTQTEFTQKVGEFLANYNAKLAATDAFTKELLEKSLLASRNLELKLPNQESYNLTGLYVIDEKKLNELSDDEFLSLKQKGIIAPIYAMLFSMSRIQKLIRLAAK